MAGLQSLRMSSLGASVPRGLASALSMQASIAVSSASAMLLPGGSAPPYAVGVPSSPTPCHTPHAARLSPASPRGPLELVFTLCWRCTKASLLALVTEMRNLANKEERNTKVNQLGRLAFEILPSILNDGYVDSRDIEALRNQKGVGEWSVEQLQQLCDTGACSYLMALRARRQ